MRHVPHLCVPGPWEASAIELDPGHARHLTRVLRLRDGDRVSYTDGRGNIGEGSLEGATILRGPEQVVDRPAPEVSVAVAAPRALARQRFIVEKLAELGVDRLYWLVTRLGEGRPPKRKKAAAWARAALEQSHFAATREQHSISPSITEFDCHVYVLPLPR